MSKSTVTSLAVKDATATTNTLSYRTDKNNSDYKALAVALDHSLCTTPVFSFARAVCSFPPASPTIVQLQGSATKTVRILKVTVTSTEAAAGTLVVSLARADDAATGAAGGTATPAKHDTEDSAAATAALLDWHTKAVSISDADQVDMYTAMLGVDIGTSSASHTWDFTQPGSKPIVLRGTSEFFVIDLNGGTAAALSFGYSITWSEDDA